MINLAGEPEAPTAQGGLGLHTGWLGTLQEDSRKYVKIRKCG